mmetsp:Transcript_7466/g.8472  ORF Transcript_7466/g.8472 Transcript_7466/m.8472 type:complete len:344 (+) Transcript_7466:24-1055(+)|eukprot:CAMPEP_0205827892 /NCGR_PEP_ID=MMETSP0206-20130828/33396_1 /ASSEMBLY_ACC=CAM_ASM_000279 /TAXON_ID=36767 /ORGANISM="Euplotes focardii, Strain TN1" /LENGTH=343 /DNA_ID=CAMNT_0053129191 /DNA_START=22 /DNA_END=1053 /DNA_ORIENTATION=+
MSKKPVAQDNVYKYDQDHIDMLNKERPWEKDVKFFNKTKVSALAAMKMLKHSLEGVRKGRARNGGKGMSLEVMGLMIGKPEGDTIVVLDCCALPVEGEENFVSAEGEVQRYMLEMMESMELRRKERFIGWYHSHPFDVGIHSHCFMSGTDVQTQFSWQNGIKPWTAIVIDPLRSIAKKQPQFSAFRCYPVKHNPPAGQGPDGKPVGSRNWGVTPNRYYQMGMSFFMSSLGKRMVDIMSRNNLWIRVLSSSAVMEPENRRGFPDRAGAMTTKLNSASDSHHSGAFARRGRGQKGGEQNKELNQAAKEASDLAIEQCAGHSSQIVKDFLFNSMLSEEKEDEEMKV